MVHGEYITLNTQGYSDVRNITDMVAGIVSNAAITDGMAHICVVGSTASVSTIEYEPALNQDLRDLLESHIPHTMHSRHSQTWGDDNGFSHLRATMMGPHLGVPVTGGRLVLGTWQQIILVDHDNRPRQRKVFVQVMGE
jgi:secondary thiamine-phosphate synthase enzyme